MCKGADGVSEEGSIGIQADGPGVEDGVENKERQENEEQQSGAKPSKSKTTMEMAQVKERMEDIEEEEDRMKDRGAHCGKRRKETDEMEPIDERSINRENRK